MQWHSNSQGHLLFEFFEVFLFWAFRIEFYVFSLVFFFRCKFMLTTLNCNSIIFVLFCVQLSTCFSKLHFHVISSHIFCLSPPDVENQQRELITKL